MRIMHYALLDYSGARESYSRVRRKGAGFEWAMKNTISVQSLSSLDRGNIDSLLILPSEHQ